VNKYVQVLAPMGFLICFAFGAFAGYGLGQVDLAEECYKRGYMERVCCGRGYGYNWKIEVPSEQTP